MERHPMVVNWKSSQWYEDSTLKVIYSVNKLCIKIPMAFFEYTGKNDLTFHMELPGALNSQKLWEKGENKVSGLTSHISLLQLFY